MDRAEQKAGVVEVEGGGCCWEEFEPQAPRVMRRAAASRAGIEFEIGAEMRAQNASGIRSNASSQVRL